MHTREILLTMKTISFFNKLQNSFINASHYVRSIQTLMKVYTCKRAEIKEKRREMVSINVSLTHWVYIKSKNNAGWGATVQQPAWISTCTWNQIQGKEEIIKSVMLGLTECLLICSLDEGEVKDTAVKCTRRKRWRRRWQGTWRRRRQETKRFWKESIQNTKRSDMKDI